jgi:hypothetical protein
LFGKDAEQVFLDSRIIPLPPQYLFAHVNRRCNLRCQHCDFWTNDDADRHNYLSWGNRRLDGKSRRGWRRSAKTARAVSRYLGAMLLARIYEVLPLSWPICHSQMRIIAFINDAGTVREDSRPHRNRVRSAHRLVGAGRCQNKTSRRFLLLLSTDRHAAWPRRATRSQIG